MEQFDHFGAPNAVSVDSFGLPGVELEFAAFELELDDSLFDFENRLQESIDKPDDDEVLQALNQSFDSLVAAGDYDRLIYASGQLAAAACMHDHLEGAAGRALDEVWGANNDDHAHDHDHEHDHEKGHSDDCNSKKGGKCSCKKGS